MEVRPGYKQTEAGVIPEDWDAVPIESLTPQNRKNGIVDGPFGSNLKTIHYRTSGIPIITSGYVTDGIFRADKYLYVDRSKFLEEQRSEVQPGDIVMAKIGERCGASAILPATHETGILSGNALKITVDESRHSTAYVWQVLWNLHVSGKLEMLRTVGAQPALSMANLKRFKIPVPPTKAEQRAIAKALSDLDELLNGLDRLIAKKRDLKQAAMQQLLSGQTRLPGFQGEWEVKWLGDIADILKGSGLSKGKTTPSGTRPCVLYGELFTTYARVISAVTSRTDCLEGRESISGDILLPGSTTTSGIDLAIASALFEGGVALGGDINIIRRRGENYDPAFLANYLTSLRKKEIAELTQGITIYHLYGRDLKTLSLELPAVPEQAAIADVIFDMDSEMAALEARRDKTRNLKQAMMHELLTGKTRLVPAGAAHA